MKKLLLVLILAAAAAFAVWFGMRSGSPKLSSTTVTSLLPRDTVAFLHVPDVHEARAQWHESDIYKLWREPAVQAFLQKPLAANPNTSVAGEKLQQLDALGMRDVFLALVSENPDDQPKFIGGFRFEGKREDAERIIGDWRNRARLGAASAPHATQTYQAHQIDVVTEGTITVATVYDRDWFFAANNVPLLQALLDRADGRVRDSAQTLGADDNYLSAFKHMPRRYIAFGYARLDQYFQKLAAITEDGSLRARVDFLKQVRSAAAAVSFENGKVHDVLFTGMPPMPEIGEITRSSLAFANSDSLLYGASFLAFPDASGMAGISTAGVDLSEWKNAFGGELGIIGDWPANARFPSVLVTLPVKDGAKARQLIRTLTVDNSTTESHWTISDKAGVQYCVEASANPMLPIAATVAVSDQLLVAGLDPGSVEAAMARRSSPSGGLASSPVFKSAERLVEAPKNAFIFVDAALLYTRLDAAIRPMLVMAAAFLPSMMEAIDVAKLPDPEVVTKHLSPLVLSQRYENDGYLTESVGPVSIFEAAVGAIAAGTAGTKLYQQQFPGLIATPTPTPSPSPTGP